MLRAITVKSFRRSDTGQHVKRDLFIEGPENYIRELERIGSVREVHAIPAAPENKAVPHTTAGTPSSASPVVQASPQTKSNKSKGGAKKKGKKKGKKKSAASLSQTPVSE